MQSLYVRSLAKVLPILFLTALSACGSKTGTSAAPATGPTPAPTQPSPAPQPTQSNTAPSPEGAWVSNCHAEQGQAPYQLQLTFDKSIVSETIHYFSDPSCNPQTEAAMPRSFWTLYAPGAAAEGVDGAFQLTLASPLPGVQPYNIYKIDGDKLTLGVTAPTPAPQPIGPVASPSRPTALDSSLVFTRSTQAGPQLASN
jgi:hypothetical protein